MGLGENFVFDMSMRQVPSNGDCAWQRVEAHNAVAESNAQAKNREVVFILIFFLLGSLMEMRSENWERTRSKADAILHSKAVDHISYFLGTAMARMKSPAELI